MKIKFILSLISEIEILLLLSILFLIFFDIFQKK
jgi:hypothetical protein